MKAAKAKPADNLKPCPFCSSSGDTLELTCCDWRDVPKSFGIRPESNPVFCCVQCVACYSGGPNSDSRSEACERWNERSENSSATDIDNLRPCPFCGAIGSNLLIQRGDWRDAPESFEIPPDSNPVFYGVSCLVCRAGGPTGDTRRQACNRWNERPR
jgi:hypothetical protein